jgi:predicted transcriptional regulator
MMQRCYGASVRTTIDLPPDLHDLARQLAHDRRRSMSDVIADLIRLGLGRQSRDISVTKRGMPQVSIGRSVTAEDVRSLDDEE